METKNKCVRLGFSRVLCSVLLPLLCAAPWANAEDVFVGDGETLDMFSGDHITGSLYALSGSTVNIHGGQVDDFVSVSPGANVTVYGQAFALNGTPLEPIPNQVTFTGGSGTLNVTYAEGTTADLAFLSDIPINLVDTGAGGPEEIAIDIKPGSYPNTINLGSNGVVPVAILSSASFDATQVDADTVDLAGAGVAVRGKGNNTLAHEEDVNADGLMDLVVQVETENLDPGTFQDGGAVLQVKDGETVLYEGWDEITIVPPE